MKYTKQAIEDNISRCKNKKVQLQLDVEKLMGQLKENGENQAHFEYLLQIYNEEFEKEKENSNEQSKHH